jgi:nitrite reductase (NADH) small subunit
MEPEGRSVARTAEPGEPALVPLDRPPDRTQWTFSHGGRSYAVFADGDEWYVTDGACPHNGGPLAEGLVRDGVVTCPWHWYSYELATGRCRTAAGYELRRYPVVRVGGRPHTALPAPAPARTWSQILRAHAREASGPEALCFATDRRHRPARGPSDLEQRGYPLGIRIGQEAHVISGPGNERAVRAGRLLASYSDREQAISVLKAAFAQGRLAKDEFDARIGQALASRTHTELAAVTSDIPADLAGVQPTRQVSNVRSSVRVTLAASLLAAVLWAAALAAHSAEALAAAVALTGVVILTLSVAGDQMRESRRRKRSARPLPPSAVPGSS